MRRFATLAAGLALVGFSAGCSSHTLHAGEARLDLSRGSAALVGEQGRQLARTTSGRTLHRGARIKVLQGSALVHLPGGASIELRPASELHLDARPTLIAGDALATSGPKGPLTVDASEGSAQVTGVGRLTQVLGLDVEAYRGNTTIDSAGRSLPVKAPRHASVAAIGVLPATADPIAYDEHDAWDQRFLADAIDLGRRLSEPARAFGQSLRPNEGRTVGFYRQLMPQLDKQPLDDGLLDAVPGRRPEEGLVGAALALASKQGPFAARWRAVFGFRAEGAQWGLVALDQNVTDADGVSKTVTAALNRAPVDFAAGGAGGGGQPSGAGTSTSGSGGGAPSPGPSSGGGSGGGGGGGTTTTTTPPNGPVPPPPATGTPADPIVQSAVDTLDGLLGPATGQQVSGVTSTTTTTLRTPVNVPVLPPVTVTVPTVPQSGTAPLPLP